MTMLSEELLLELAPRTAPLEREEPVVACWRYHASTTARWRPRLYWYARAVADWLTARRRRPAAAGRVIVLKFIDTPATWGSVAPVVDELRARGANPTVIAMRDSVMAPGDVSYVALSSRISLLKRLSIAYRSARLARRLRGVAPAAAANAANWIQIGLVAREVARRLTDESTIVIADSDIESVRKGFVAGARDRGADTVVFQHGLFGHHHFPCHADRLAVWGDFFRDDAIRYGGDSRRVTAIGCPRWDDLPPLRHAPRDPAIRARLGGSDTRPLVLVISNTQGITSWERHYASFFKSVEKLVASDALDVAIRLHPTEEGLRSYEQYLGPTVIQRIRTTPPDISLYDAMRHSDVAYNVFSSAALEAMLIGVPVLFEDAENEPKLCRFPDLGGGRWTNYLTIVDDCIAAARTSRDVFLSEQDAFVRTAFSNLGSATAAAADFLLDLT